MSAVGACTSLSKKVLKECWDEWYLCISRCQFSLAVKGPTVSFAYDKIGINVEFPRRCLTSCDRVFDIGDAVVTETLVKFERDVRMDGQIDITNVIRTTNKTNTVECARSCANDASCVAFYINPTTRTCQQQSAQSNSEQIGLESSTGYRYYQNCSSPSVPYECPINNGGWSIGQLPDGKYLFKFFNDTNVDHATAFNICKSIGANLPKIYEADKMNFYLDPIFTCPDLNGMWFWVVGTNLNAPVKTSLDAWTTHDGIVIPLIPELWYPDRPNDPDTVHCIQSRSYRFDYMLDDTACTEKLYKVLCEKKISC